MSLQFRLKLLPKVATHITHVLQKVIPLDNPLHGQSRSTSNRMTLVRLSMSESTTPLVQRLHDIFANQHARHRRISTTQTLAHGLYIWHDAFLLPGVKGAAATDTGHDLVEDEEGAVFLAHGFHGGEVAWYCRDATEGLTLHVSSQYILCIVSID